MDIPAVLLLCLEQQDRSLEDHTRDFFACQRTVPRRILPLSWIYFCPTEEDISSPTPEPETSQPSSHCMEQMPEPTIDREHKPAATREPESIPATEPIVAPEPGPQDRSNQVREPITSPVPKGVLVEIEGLEGSPTHTPAAEGELQLASGMYYEELMDIFQMDLIDWFGEVLPSSTASPLVPPSSCSPVFPPSLPLPPPLQKPVSSSAPSPLVPVSTSAHPHSAPSGRSDPPRDFQSPAPPWRDDPLSPPPASEPWTPPQSFDPSAPPWLLAPSFPPWPIIPQAPPGALIPPAPPEPETSQPSSHCMEQMPEPTIDREHKPAATREPESIPATEPIVAPEPGPQDRSNQVREPITSPVPKGVLVEIEGLEGSPTHTPAAEGELQLASGMYYEELMDIFQMDLIDWFGEVLPSSTASPLVPPSSCSPVFPPSLPLPPPLQKPVSSSAPSPLVPVSTSAHPHSAPSGRSDPPRDFQSPAPPWPPSSPPWPIIPQAPPGTLIPPAPLWSVVNHPPPWESTPLALSGSSFPPGPLPSSVAPAPPQSSGAPPLPRSPEPSAPPWPSGSSVSPWLSVCSALSWAPLPPAQSPSVGPRCCRPYLHHGSSWPLELHLVPPAPVYSLTPPYSTLAL
ncbi:vegetative cell wall protein gp1-like [Sinocyclocheilus grahami]|uniref:vegetative cell wall protein gp1-like n=1 Tax=Sinocyclocheilus grahami TaxID=75366 RepID=UPI0007AC890B|nr:PREDICTED: vegetative cell wall protein gp1-like [Sinocyclocheilus grahami]